jgi:oligosaccharide repeat unit polymerase
MLRSTDNRSCAAAKPREKRGLGKLKYWDQLAILGSVVILAINALCYYLGAWQIYWGSCAVVLLCTAVPFLVTWRSPLAGYFCFPNIFVALLALFHIGYYVPVRLGWVAGFDYMPSVDNPAGDLAMLLYCCAVVSFTVGVSCGVFWATRKKNWTPALERDRRPSTKAITMAGACIISFSLFFFAVFLLQMGSFGKILRLSYTDYIDFLTYRDPRFLQTFVAFMPVGLLLLYAGLSSRKPLRRSLFYLDLTSIVYIVWLTLIGARGPAFLFAMGVLYVRHICYRRLSTKVVASAAIIFLVAIPIVASYRNLPSGERAAAVTRAGLDPLASVIEMGATYRTLYAFSAVFGLDRAPMMMGESYVKAAEDLLPNLGLHKDTSEVGHEDYRSSALITELSDRVSDSQRLRPNSAGSTGIGEPFANFGYFGVVMFFGALGFSLALLEAYSLTARSITGAAVLGAVFIPVNWYIRDDIYGLARAVVWPLAIIFFAYLIFSGRARGRAKAGRPILSRGPQNLTERSAL